MTQGNDDEKRKALKADALKTIAKSGLELAYKRPEDVAIGAAVDLGSSLLGNVGIPWVRSKLRWVSARLLGLLEAEASASGTPVPDLSAQPAADVLGVIFGSVLQSPDAAVLPALAALAADYTSKGQQADPFLRKAARMLVDCNAEELSALRAVLAWARQNAEPERDVEVVGLWGEERRTIVRVAKAESEKAAPNRVADIDNALRAIELLAGSQIGRHRSVSGGVATVLSLDAVDRLTRAVNASPPAVDEPPAP